MANEATRAEGNQVDAALLPATVAAPLVARGDAHLLGWVGDETPWQLGAVFAANKHDRRPVAPRWSPFSRPIAAARAIIYDAFLRKDPDGTADDGAEAPAMLAIIAKYTGQKPELIKTAIPYVDPEGRLLVRDIYHQIAWYQASAWSPRT